VLLGIGDDAAVWQASRSRRSVITTDALVDGVHFRTAQMSAAQIGHRAMAANLSDIAAMGARPVLATVALGIAADTSEEWIRELYGAMAALLRRFGASIAGGDLVRSPALTLSITVVGDVSQSRLKTRAGGRAGDVLAVTGKLGASRAGLALLDAPLALDPQLAAAARAAFATPEPRVREGCWLGASVAVRAMMDCSDGVSTDVARLAAASDCGAVIERVPVAPAAAAVADAAGDDPLDYALSGGEDFELLVAVAPRAFPRLQAAFARRFGRPLERLGALSAAPGIVLATDGKTPSALAPGGWDHVRGAVSRRA
jgi:thiamine-monophosphate kinase